MKSKRTCRWIYILIWILTFAMVNYPIGAWASNKLTPFILGFPFSVFYFWAAYSLLILAGVLLAWKVMRD
ncbi:hypothetical protein KQI82_06480 [Oscillibacter sp. MSJ-2]|uniref:DUF3311 domain-containing protein n=1 Tax=Dysosmobacter acutus TaxID=2841504 RepID=A0ABS6F8G4_9FIRM|nr:hypothetical protein [Dysosmobacter acutus]MBU5626565.1 hypothetical protein [Dysosmobacter acutus]